METVKFQCSHCGNLMAVTVNLLGQQVRCPHCQQIVTAPPPAATVVVPNLPAPAASYDLSFSVKKEQNEHESIFAEGGGEDIFGQPPQPRLELPPEPAPPNPELQPTSFPVPSVVVPAMPPPGPVEPTMFQQTELLPPVQMLETTEFRPEMGLPELPAADGNPFGPSLGEHTADVAVDGTSDLPSGPISATPSGTLSQPRAGGAKLLYWLLIFLLPYSMFITAVAIWYYFQWRNKPSPLEALPDIMGDYKDSTKKGSGPRSYQMPAHDSPLPEKLRIALGQAVDLGDLQVVAEKVELDQITFLYRGRGRDPEIADTDSLVLHLRLKNISRDVYFHPTDPYFDRRWIEGKDALPPPYTFLEAGTKRFYGGAVPARRDDSPREYVQGQEENDKDLKPGQELQTVVCTAYEDDVPRQLRNYKGNLLWRIQLRRGLVHIGDQDYPVTAVIGVQFTMNDVHRRQ